MGEVGAGAEALHFTLNLNVLEIRLNSYNKLHLELAVLHHLISWVLYPTFLRRLVHHDIFPNGHQSKAV
jgi:hypothetical protein